MGDLDVELHDHELADEIALLGELMAVASRSAGALDPAAIDGVLGVTSVRSQN